MKRSWQIGSLAGAALGLVLLSSASARAEYPAPAPYIGVFGGGSIPLRNWDLGQNTNEDTKRPDGAAGMVGGRLGVQLLKPLALEGEFSYLPVKSTIGGTNKVQGYSLNAIYHILPGNWTPYVGAGIGIFRTASGDLGKDAADQRTHVGIGLRGLVTPSLALRAEARDVITDAFGSGGSHLLQVHAGIDLFLSTAEKPVQDRDRDGVLDAEDRCPDEAGSKELQGCPDRDKDKIIDKNDKCPDVPGVEQFQGCPDSDGDGVADASDECPAKPGPIATQGCPDKDNDGVADSQDQCPEIAGPKETGGCPDADKDGVIDPEDKCPQLAGPKDKQGCPDRDNDKVIDPEDKCPDTPGLVEHQGCLPEAAKKFTGAIKGIYFDTGSAKIKAQSNKVLDEAVAVLKKYEGMRLRIEGHTDNQGKADMNQKLSQERAASVKAYLVKKGIAESRLESEGFGDTRPAQSNDTPAGRTANRRIEFVPIGQK